MSDLPEDIDPESLNRLPLPRRDELDEGGKAVFDYFGDPKGKSLGGLRGPGMIRVHSPRLAQAWIPLVEHFRSAMPGKLRETAILATAREHTSQFEWMAHEPQARKDGVSDEVIEIIRHRRAVDGLPELERTVITMARQLMSEHRLDAQVYTDALRLLGRQGVVDVVSLMCHYAATAHLLAAFDAHLPPDAKPGLPPL